MDKGGDRMVAKARQKKRWLSGSKMGKDIVNVNFNVSGLANGTKNLTLILLPSSVRTRAFVMIMTRMMSI